MPVLSWGVRGYLAIFASLMLAGLLASPQRIGWVVLLGAGLTFVVFPGSGKQVLSVRSVMLLVLVAGPALFLGSGSPDVGQGFTISSAGVGLSIVLAARVLVVLMAVNGLASRVAPTALADLLEGLGLRGLGFAFGVALNMLPSLRRACETSWHALRMRGGFGRQWPVAIRLLSVTVLTSALRRAEEIALAAEIRGFDPERPRKIELRHGRLDPVAYIMGAALLALVLLPRLAAV